MHTHTHTHTFFLDDPGEIGFLRYLFPDVPIILFIATMSVVIGSFRPALKATPFARGRRTFDEPIDWCRVWRSRLAAAAHE